MKSSLFISLLIIVAAGCKSIAPTGIIRDESAVIENRGAGCQGSSPVLCLLPGSSLLFKASIDIRTRYLSGLMLIKRLDSVPEPGYRVVFANEVGMTFFDLEVTSGSFRVMSAFPSLNKKALMKILATDIRALTLFGSLEKERYYRRIMTGDRVLSGKSGKYEVWEVWSPAGDELLSVFAGSNIADPVAVSFLNHSSRPPSSIMIENPVIGMKIGLRLLNKN